MLWGLDPHYTKLYLEEYAPTNPLIPAHLAADAGDILAASRMPLWNDFINSSFFRDWGGPQGFLDSLSAIVERTPTRLSMVSCIRHKREGLVDDISFARMGLLRPHFLRAIKIGQALELRTVQVQNLADTLDGLAAGVFIIDERGNLAHSNASGRELLSGEKIFRLRGGRLQAVNPAADAGIASSLMQMRDSKIALDRRPAVALEAETGPRYFAHLLPLTVGFRHKMGLPHSASAAIFVVKTALDVTAATEMIRDKYRLNSGRTPGLACRHRNWRRIRNRLNSGDFRRDDTHASASLVRQDRCQESTRTGEARCRAHLAAAYIMVVNSTGRNLRDSSGFRAKRIKSQID